MGLNVFVCAQATWQSMGCSIKVRESALVDLLDSSPPDCNQMHMLNLEPSIALVKFGSCDLISQSTNHGVTHSSL